MTKATFFKFIFLSQSNMRRFLIVNLLLLVPLGVFLYALVQLVPVAIRYVDSFNARVEQVSPDYEKLAIVILSGSATDGEQKEGRVYVLDRRDFNALRKHIFLSGNDARSAAVLEERSLGSSPIPFFTPTLTIHDKSGKSLITLGMENPEEDVLEILFINSRKGPRKVHILLNLLLLGAGFTLTFGSLGGVSDYTQRVVFHEAKELAYFFWSVKKYFIRSCAVALFIAVVIGAIVTNIYFYIFIISNDVSVFIAALNFWMLVFFIFILLWVYPLFILNRDESIWKVMKKSLFVSFDNFEFTFDALVLILLMLLLSCLTLFTVPGFTGIFSFMNSALKDISYRYSRADSA